MEITKKQAGRWTELRVKGRLDSYWADHFKSALDEMIREGAHHISLNMSGVTYISSAGVGALIHCHKQLQGVRGKLTVANPSQPVKEVLEVTRLTLLLPITESESVPTSQQTVTHIGRKLDRKQVSFMVYDQEPDATLSCQLIGDPALLIGCRFGENDCRKVQFPAQSFGFGLGALGNTFADCQGRFGEFLAAASAVAYLPTDGANVPDYLVAAGDSVADLQVCYGLLCEGQLAHLIRFEADPQARSVSLTELVSGFLDVAEADRVGFVLLAETAGLMGAALRRSPASNESEGTPFNYPEIRNWLSFAAERAYPRSLALVVGVAARRDAGPLAAFIRPLGTEPSLLGHCHAAAFSFRPLPRGNINLRNSVASLFEGQTLQGILHLLADYRSTVGLGESEFIRGACWCGPIDKVLENRS